MSAAARTFTELAAELGGGSFEIEATKLLQEIAERIRRHGGDGRLVITIAMKDAGGGAIDVDTSFRTKKPHAPIPTTKVWADKDGTILASDPHQEVLPFRPRGPRGPRDVS